MSRSRRGAAAAALVWLVVAALTVLPGGAARADQPLRLNEQLTDRSDVLGGRAGEAAGALQRLRTTTGLQLFVVFVHTFSGRGAQQWADDTAIRSGLGDRDALLAVATHDREFAYSFPRNFPLSDAELASVAATAIEPPLAANDWAGAVVGASDGYAAALAGQPIPTPAIQPGQPDPTGGGGGRGALIGGLVAAGLVVLGIGAFALYRRRRRTAGRRPAAEPAGTPTPALHERANSLLVELDDELRSSEQELAIAQGQYGAEATAGFTAALERARAEVAEAFRLRLTLDEHTGDDAATRTVLTEIIRRCEEADRRLDAEADAFDRLREIEPNVESLSAGLGRRATALSARLSAAEGAVADLGRRYTGPAVTTVAANPTQARERLGFVTTALARADASAAAGRRPEAALAVRAAEEAVRQAETLLDGVDEAGTNLAAARAAADALLTEIDAEVVEARAARPDPDGALTTAATAATAVTTSVRAGLGADRTDPAADLRRLQEADAQLDRALAASRDQAQRAARARTQLGQALPVARAEVAAADQYLTTRRAALGPQPRTLLAEAHRQLARAEALATDDPGAALAAAQEAGRFASAASQAAYAEVESWQPGPWGQPRYGRGGVGGEALLGAMLGGILAGGGGRYRSRSAGWGGGFGGSATRSRRTGGGGFGGGRRGGGGRF
ncbi:TPM domain-containing protein [Asanoa siamensis]|uniref:TPM domain-containing protein n=1 Tax=Asanoa siamensis TaxID=926357 RepID=A0ABQ4CT35_9ACTN|nr:TPM domain-containing protein [Asanoa siamensis]GIF74456.1 hypothetical protein Asi02nite_39740 [Asanoa siamensis]